MPLRRFSCLGDRLFGLACGACTCAGRRRRASTRPSNTPRSRRALTTTTPRPTRPRPARSAPRRSAAPPAGSSAASDGAVLRQFSDSNADNIVDTWSYYRGGLEVYRDIDANFNGKADQYRWFHTGGSRWGLDKNEDGKIDAWKSDQRRRSGRRSRRRRCARRTRPASSGCCVDSDDVGKLGLAKAARRATRQQRIAAAPKAFSHACRRRQDRREGRVHRLRRPDARLPCPAGTRGSTKDLLVYENVWCMVLTGEQAPAAAARQHGRTSTAAWKLIDGPAHRRRRRGLRRLLLRRRRRRPPQTPVAALNEPTEEMQKILEAIEKVDEQLDSGRGRQESRRSTPSAPICWRSSPAANARR